MAAPNNPGPITFVIGSGLRSNPNVHRAAMWPLESADRSRVGVVVAGKTLRNAKVRSARSTYFCERTEMIRGKQFGSGQYELNTESTKDEPTCRAVKGPDERPLRDALDSSPSHHRRGYADGKQLIRKAATSALTFMTFS
jgi:hypothetical protein